MKFEKSTDTETSNFKNTLAELKDAGVAEVTVRYIDSENVRIIVTGNELAKAAVWGLNVEGFKAVEDA